MSWLLRVLAAWPFTGFHLFLSLLVIIDLVQNNQGALVTGLGLAIMATVTFSGALVMLFVILANDRYSEQCARYGFVLAVAFLCVTVAIVFFSWTYFLGWWLVSLLFFAESIIAFILALRTVKESREFRQKETFLSVC